jgi:hypothetical protein
MNPLTQRFLALIFSVQAAVAFPAGAEEIILRPDGVNADAEWALSRIGEEFSGTAVNSYSYPDSTVPVRLYLVDTAVANPASFVAANPKLTFEGPILVRGNNDPTVSKPRAHGTQMLSLITGVETGIAPGTPIHVVNYDIYPNATTTNSLLSSAISKAIAHHKNPNTPKMRAAICIATSSTESASSYMIGVNIDAALAAGIPVILSAGNLGQDAATIVPSSNGTKDGVICVGASNTADLKLGISNFGAPVDILAPGDGVRTRSQSATSAFVAMTGTSASAALVAGSVLAELSINGSLTPAQVEGAIKASAVIPTSGPGLLRTTYASMVTIINPDGPVIPSTSPLLLAGTASLGQSQPISKASVENNSAITPSQDSDSDGIPDMIEIFHSGNSDKIPAPAVLSLTADQKIQFKFPIAFDLFRSANPFALVNGYRWSIRCTSDFKNWEIPVGSLSKTTDAMGQIWLTATFPASQPACFATIEITAP